MTKSVQSYSKPIQSNQIQFSIYLIQAYLIQSNANHNLFNPVHTYSIQSNSIQNLFNPIQLICRTKCMKETQELLHHTRNFYMSQQDHHFSEFPCFVKYLTANHATQNAHLVTHSFTASQVLKIYCISFNTDCRCVQNWRRTESTFQCVKTSRATNVTVRRLKNRNTHPFWSETIKIRSSHRIFKHQKNLPMQHSSKQYCTTKILLKMQDTKWSQHPRPHKLWKLVKENKIHTDFLKTLS